MISKYSTTGGLLLLLALQCNSQKLATLEVDLSRFTMAATIPVSVDLDEITFVADSALALHQVQGASRTATPFQVSYPDHRRLHWLVNTDGKPRKVSFELSAVKTSKVNPTVRTEWRDGALILQTGSQKLLQYQAKMIYPPQGVDTAYRRNGFIHPLWSPHGQELTRIQPKDHYHHYGIWNPWTHVLYRGDTVDFWNIRGRKGTVRHAGFASRSDGDVFTGFAARHEHVATKKDTPPEVAMNEIFAVVAYLPSPDYYLVDVTSTLSVAGSEKVTLLEYRYGGLGWRATQQWDNKNSEVMSSDGKTRKDADGSKAKWCIIQGSLDNDYGGAIMMSHPANYNHPEPLRIWPENQYDRGDMFANFSPTKDKDWVLEPGRTYQLRYRFLVFNGKMTPERAEDAWQGFARPPKVNIKLN